MVDRCRRLTDDTSGTVSFPVELEYVRRSRLSRGDRILLRPDEPVPRDGELLAVLSENDREPTDTSCSIETEAGERDHRSPGDAVKRGELIRESTVVVEITRRAILWWFLAAVSPGVWVWSQKARIAVSIGVIVLGFTGTGLGGFNPVEAAMQESGVAEQINTTIGPSVDSPTQEVPRTVPTVTVTPPNTTESATATRTATVPPPGTTATKTAPQTITESVTDPGTETATATLTDTPTRTDRSPTREPSPENPEQPTETTTPIPTATPAVSASLSITASDPPLFRSNDGTVGRIEGSIAGTLRWSTDRVDGVVLVVQVWVPGEGWAEMRRVQLAEIRNLTIGSPINLRAVLGDEVIYANGTRADVFENPDPGTIRKRSGRVGVTAVLFDGDTEVARVTASDGFNVSVRNVEFDLELGSADSDSNNSEAAVSLLSAERVAPGTDWVNRGELTNTGTVPGEISLTNLTITSFENGRTEPEAEVDDTGGDPGNGAGELHDALKVRIAVVDSNGTRRYVYGSGDTYRPLESPDDGAIRIAEADAGETLTLVVEYRVSSDAGNEIQSDSVTIDFGFTMVEIS